MGAAIAPLDEILEKDGLVINKQQFQE